jgi:hypothetical protein
VPNIRQKRDIIYLAHPPPQTKQLNSNLTSPSSLPRPLFTSPFHLTSQLQTASTKSHVHQKNKVEAKIFITPKKIPAVVYRNRGSFKGSCSRGRDVLDKQNKETKSKHANIKYPEQTNLDGRHVMKIFNLSGISGHFEEGKINGGDQCPMYSWTTGY